MNYLSESEVTLSVFRLSQFHWSFLLHNHDCHIFSIKKKRRVDFKSRNNPSINFGLDSPCNFKLFKTNMNQIWQILRHLLHQQCRCSSNLLPCQDNEGLKSVWHIQYKFFSLFFLSILCAVAKFEHFQLL